MTDQATHIAIIVDAEDGEPIMTHAIPGTSDAEARAAAMDAAAEAASTTEQNIRADIRSGALLLRVLPIAGRA